MKGEGRGMSYKEREVELVKHKNGPKQAHFHCLKVEGDGVGAKPKKCAQNGAFVMFRGWE